MFSNNNIFFPTLHISLTFLANYFSVEYEADTFAIDCCQNFYWYSWHNGSITSYNDVYYVCQQKIFLS